MRKEDLKTRMEKSINQWGKELVELESRTDSVPEDKKQKHQEEMEALERKIEEAKIKATELNESPDNQWENLKEGFNKAWKSLINR
ncbi:MAG: hypothetical protein ACOCYD_00145 [bacterium]